MSQSAGEVDVRKFQPLKAEYCHVDQPSDSAGSHPQLRGSRTVWQAVTAPNIGRSNDGVLLMHVTSRQFDWLGNGIETAKHVPYGKSTISISDGKVRKRPGHSDFCTAFNTASGFDMGCEQRSQVREYGALGGQVLYLNLRSWPGDRESLLTLA